MARILMVEDDPNQVLLLRFVVEDDGLDVDAVGDLAGLRACLDGPVPDAVVLDRGLPDGDGVELLRVLRLTDGWQDVPVVVLSGHDADAAVWEGWAAGANSYVTKPYEPELLRRVLLEQLAAAHVEHLDDLDLDALASVNVEG